MEVVLIQVGNTALMEAAYGGHEEIVDLLLQKHANVNLKDFVSYV